MSVCFVVDFSASLQASSGDPIPLPEIGLRIGMHPILANETWKEFYRELLKKCLCASKKETREEQPFLPLDAICLITTKGASWWAKPTS